MTDAETAITWMVDYASRCTEWERFLKEFTVQDGKYLYAHEHLRKARRIKTIL